MIYLNGHLIREVDARIDISDRGFTLGDGLFETMRAYRGNIFRLGNHLDRLEEGARELGIPLPLEKPTLITVLDRLIRENNHKKSDASLRITLTRGPGPRGVLPPPEPRPTLLITTAPINPSPRALWAVL